MSFEMKLPGKDGVALRFAADRDLLYWEGVKSKQLAAPYPPDKERYKPHDERLLAAIRTEQQRRASGGAPAAQAITKQAEPVDVAKIIGTLANATELNSRLAEAAKKCHLLSPTTIVGDLPVGTALSISVVHINVDEDCYEQSRGKYALTKSALDRVAMQLGISWDPRESGRLDDGSNAYYCRWRAVATYIDFDTRKLTKVGEKEIDLRDGSPQLDEMQEQARGKFADDGTPKNADRQIMAARMHIQTYCESKAKNRAIRSFGIKPSYTPEQLAKPFIAVRSVFTGQTDDPELKRIFAQMIAHQFFGGHRALYGAAPREESPRLLSKHPPPPPGQAGRFDDDDAVTTHGEAMPAGDDDGYDEWNSMAQAQGDKY